MKKRLNCRFAYLIMVSILTLQVSAQNILYTETFGSCEFPDGWETYEDFGGVRWIIDQNIRQDPDYGDKCFLYYADNKKVEDSVSIWVSSPWVQPINSDKLFIDFKLLFSKNLDDPQTLDIYYENGSSRNLFMSFDSTFWGATFNDYGDLTIEIDNSNPEPIRVLINYRNHGERNAFVSLDNFIFRGFQNSVCEEAVDLIADQSFCEQGNNGGINYETVTDACQGYQTIRPVWYRFIPEESGIARVTTSSSYNDVLDVYYGRCDDLVPFRCSNSDEYGFVGEEIFFPATKNIVYYLRMSALEAPFSPGTQGDHCIQVELVNNIPSIGDHDFCSGALEVVLNGDCVAATTHYAETTDPDPSLNQKARADVWYTYTHSIDRPINIETNANFSDGITLYTGNCLFGLTEIDGTHQGPDMPGVKLDVGATYYIKVSGSFSTISGDLCLAISEANEEPDNDDCNTSLALTMNDDICKEASTLFATNSGQRSSCQIKNGPDVWFSFVAPNSGDVSLDVNADFIFDLALYTGLCDSLKEVYCGYNPHRCQGYVNIEKLTPGEEYFIQVSSHQNSFGEIRGALCLSIYETDKAPTFTPLSLNTEIECLFGRVGVLTVEVEGGEGQVSTFGNSDGDWLLPGDSYIVIAEDESGCRQISQGFSECEVNESCDQSDLDVQLGLECELDQLGLPTGRARVVLSTSGGNGQLTFEGHSQGDIITEGGQAQVAVQDETGCVVVRVVKNECEKFTCAKSDLAIDVDYDCVDTLFRAVLDVEAREGYGNYTFSGNQDGDQLENGETYTCIVSDEAGCSDTLSGIIMCMFDSCAYSALNLSIEIECIMDNSGNRTGEAILNISTEGGVGQLTISGGQTGDTLGHGDSYLISVKDEWGCSQLRTGTVRCEPTTTSTSNPSALTARVYPVPTRDKVMLDLLVQTSGEYLFELISQSGQTVYSSKSTLRSGDQLIPFLFGEQPSGVYHLRISNEELVGVCKVVVE